jgi:DNA-binding transcriptional LysR family regulator
MIRPVRKSARYDTRRSMPQRLNSRAYCTASASMPALAAKYGERYGGDQRTVRGERLLHELESFIPRLEALVRGEEFDPLRSRERFRVGLTDHASGVLLPPLLERLRAEAPGIALDVSGWQSHMYDDVAAGRLNMALSAEAVPASLETEVLYKETFVCIVGSRSRAAEQDRTDDLSQPVLCSAIISRARSLSSRGLQQPIFVVQSSQYRRHLDAVPFFWRRRKLSP